MIQSELILPERRSLAELAHAIGDHRTGGVLLTVTRNRISMASVRFPRSGAVVRLHEAFLSAPDEVLTALRAYLRTRRRADWTVVAAFARTIRADKHHPVRAPRLSAQGRVFDLAAIAEEVNGTFFAGSVRCKVGWGRDRPRRRSRRWWRGRSIRYGSWDVATRTVRVHPLLDDPRVPREFVRYIVFHEMLHAVVPGQRRGGRLMHHPREFRILERQFPDLNEMNRLAKRLLDLLV